jgi:hypothetical protein
MKDTQRGDNRLFLCRRNNITYYNTQSSTIIEKILAMIMTSLAKTTGLAIIQPF